MKKQPALTTGISEPDSVDDFIKSLKHPLRKLVIDIRKDILAIDPALGESVAWNAPLFFYTGEMESFDPKDYKRYVVGFNLFKKDSIRMIFLRGALASDPKGILEGDYKDGRRIVTISSPADWKKIAPEFRKIVIQLLKKIEP